MTKITDGFGFDEQGRPITMTDEQVAAKINAAIGHPDATLLLAVYMVHGEAHVKVNGAPTRVVLQAMEMVVDRLRKIVEGH